MSAATVAAIAKAAVAVLSNEKTRKALGWVIVAILSPLIVLVVLICAVLSGSSQHNVSAVELCFHGGTISSSATPEYRGYIENMRGSFAQLDRAIEEINAQCEDGNSLDDTRVKAVFYALYFAAEHPDDSGIRAFTDCFVDYEERTRTVTTTDEEGNEVEVEETYTVAIPVTDMNEVYARIEAAMGITVTPENQSNADSIYNIVLYGTATGTGDWFPGADVPFISVDGFCSPVGANWESIVTSEFGYRRDPFTGETRGHSGMDLAVPTGTPIRAALPGTVTVSQYNAGGYGYYVMIDHGNGLSTLYGHNSRLLAQVGQTVEAGDMCSKHLLICWLFLLCTQRTGSNTAMWRSVVQRNTPCSGCWNRIQSCKRLFSAWIMMRLGSRQRDGSQTFCVSMAIRSPLRCVRPTKIGTKI